MARADTIIAGRFAPRDILGSGAWGTVIEVMDLRLRRLVALKLIRTGPDGMEPQRIAIEAQAAARLSHPNIISVHDAGEGPDYAWIAMDLVIGETLSAALRRQPALAEAEVARLGRELLAALGHAHGRGVLHRDVKPAHILLATHAGPGPGTVRLGDFGVARLGRNSELTAVGGLVGTPAWMAPEQLRGEAIDHRADLWAAGAIMLEALTGRRPFGHDILGAMHRIQHEPAPVPSALRPGLHPGWDGFFARALAKPAAERFPDAEAMAAALPL